MSYFNFKQYLGRHSSVRRDTMEDQVDALYCVQVPEFVALETSG